MNNRMIDVEDIPRDVLQRAVNLRNALRIIYLEMVKHGKPSSATELAEKTGYSRPYVSMKLNDLVDMGYLESHREGKVKIFEVKKE